MRTVPVVWLWIVVIMFCSLDLVELLIDIKGSDDVPYYSVLLVFGFLCSVFLAGFQFGIDAEDASGDQPQPSRRED